MAVTSAGRVAAPAGVSLRGAYYTLGVLMLVYVINFIDRQVLSILMEPIKRDLGLTDSQLGLLSGFSFALFYAVAGLPIARLADRTSRRNIVAGSMTLWSAMTALCGLAATFPQLLLGRVGVAVGEAGAGPPAHSMIADLFPHGRRSTALAVFATGVPIGILVGLVAGGWLNQAFNWRIAFAVVGAPGLLVSILVVATVREPARSAEAAAGEGASPAALRTLWRIRPLPWLVLAAAVHAYTAYGALQWTPAFMIRTFHMTTAQAGLSLGLLAGLTGIAGTLGGGWLGDRLGRRDLRWYAWSPALLIALGAPFYLAAYLWAPSAPWALLLLILPNAFGNSFTGPTYAMVQTLTPPRYRAFASAVLLFMISLIGFGLGPLSVGLASDSLHAAGVAAPLRPAMAALVLGDVIAVLLYLVAARAIRHSRVEAP